MNNIKNIGIVGQGFVGTAVREKFKNNFKVFAYDKDETKSIISEEGESDMFTIGDGLQISTLVEECNIIFVCVPTPMFENGECDTSIVKSVLVNLAEEAEDQKKSITVILKSTVPPGTTQILNKISDKISVVFSPEFLTEANATEDFNTQNRIILGIDYMELVDPMRNLFKTCFPDADILIFNSNEAEMTKYTTNLFLATKVSFFNDIYLLCEKLGINYDNVIEATMHDPRIGKSHYNVPGPDGDFGFGGHCFPKDLQAILKIAQDFGLALPTITGTHITNMIVRQNKDWLEMEGRAVTFSSNGKERVIPTVPPEDRELLNEGG